MENKGTIASLNEKGFGFIEIEGRKSRLFFHVKELVRPLQFSELNVGDHVEFDSIDHNEKGDAAKSVYLA